MAVEMAVAIAPGYARYVAVAAWLASLSLAVAWIWGAHASGSEFWMRANAWFTWTLYVIASSLTAFLLACDTTAGTYKNPRAHQRRLQAFDGDRVQPLAVG